jgi:hypothetical protein
MAVPPELLIRGSFDPHQPGGQPPSVTGAAAAPNNPIAASLAPIQKESVFSTGFFAPILKGYVPGSLPGLAEHHPQGMAHSVTNRPRPSYRGLSKQGP